MPLHDMLEDALSVRFDHVAMAWDNAIEIPLVDLRHAPRESTSITCTNAVPQKPLLPIALCVRKKNEHLSQDPTPRVNARFTELLCRRRIEDEIGLDEGSRRLVVEDDLLVGVRRDELVFEFSIELRVDAIEWFGFREDVGEGNVLDFLRFALFGEAFGTEDFGVGVRLMPGTKENVMLFSVSSA
jgi:hypothetical protein